MRSKITKVLSVSLIVVLLSSLFCGCNRVERERNLIREKDKFERVFFKAFDDRDVEGMYDLFSDAEKEDETLKDTIEVLFYYWDLLNLDESNSDRFMGIGGYSLSDGVYTEEHDVLYVKKCVDEYDNPFFGIVAEITMINKYKPGEIGINQLFVNSANSKLFYPHGCSGHYEENEITMNSAKYMKEVLDELFSLKKTDEYWAASYDERVQMGMDVLNQIVERQMDEYGFSVVEQDSIHRCMYDDSYNFYPDVGFYFYNGIEIEFPIADERDENQKLSIAEIDKNFITDNELSKKHR